MVRGFFYDRDTTPIEAEIDSHTDVPPVDIHIGDCRTMLQRLAKHSVHCVVTSPPYFALRDYANLPGQIGNERNVNLYIDDVLDVAEQIRRVLRPDGVFWLNIADRRSDGTERNGALTNKNLHGLPWLLAHALQRMGWTVRSDIIWVQPAPLPESASDRPTHSYQHIFMLTKSEQYYFDEEALREPGKAGERGARLRDVWVMANEPFPNAHFATFPTELPARCIQLSTSAKGCCAECGAPYRRVTEREQGRRLRSRVYTPNLNSPGAGLRDGGYTTAVKTIGWKPTCDHDADVVPCTVLDPFGGCGTTGIAASLLHRHGVLIELASSFATDASRRMSLRGIGTVWKAQLQKTKRRRLLVGA